MSAASSHWKLTSPAFKYKYKQKRTELQLLCEVYVGGVAEFM